MERLTRIPVFQIVTAFLALIAIAMSGTYAVQAASSGSLRVRITDADGRPVENAVVEIYPSAGSTGPIRFPWRMGMAQRNLDFVPGTLIVARGSTVAFPNLDRVRHSIYSFSSPARFEFDLYGRDQTRSYTFRTAGSVKLGCNIHDNMRGYIRVTDTPFAAKTDRNGFVTLDGMPTGNAEITVWHPQLRAPRNEHRIEANIAAGAQSRGVRIRLR